MKKQNIIGITFFIIGCVLTYLYSENYYRSSAFYIGRIIGQTLIVSLLILFVLYLFKSRKRIQTLLIIGLALFFISIYNSALTYYIKNKSETFVDNTIEIFQDLNSNKVINKPSINTNEMNLNQLIQNYLAKVQNINMEYQQALKGSELNEVLLPKNLTNKEINKAAINKLIQLQNDIPKYESRLLIEMGVFEDSLASRDDNFSKSTLAGFLSTKDKGVNDLKIFYKNQEQIIETIKEIAMITETAGSNITLGEGLLMFENQDNLDYYNDLIKKLDNLSFEESSIIQSISTTQDDNLNDLYKIKNKL